MFAKSQTPLLSLAYLSFQSNKSKKATESQKAILHIISYVQYTLYSLYKVIITNTIFEDRYFRSINNQLMKNKKTFQHNQRIRLDDADWYKDLGIIRNKVAFDSFFFNL